MFRFSRAYQYTAEFEARQLEFDFAVVARAVLNIAIEGKKKAAKILTAFIRSCRDGWTTAPRRPQQLVLPSDDFHQLTFQV